MIFPRFTCIARWLVIRTFTSEEHPGVNPAYYYIKDIHTLSPSYLIIVLALRLTSRVAMFLM